MSRCWTSQSTHYTRTIATDDPVAWCVCLSASNAPAPCTKSWTDACWFRIRWGGFDYPYGDGAIFDAALVILPWLHVNDITHLMMNLTARHVCNFSAKAFTTQRPRVHVVSLDRPELSMGWVDPWVGLCWVGSTTAKVLKIWKDYVNAWIYGRTSWGLRAGFLSCCWGHFKQFFELLVFEWHNDTF